MHHVRNAGLAGTLVAALLVGGFFLPDRQTTSGPNLFRDVVTLVSTRFIDTLEVSEIYERAAEGLVDHLGDPYATLYSPADLEEFEAAYEGHYAGVGMLLEAQQGAAVVRRVFPNTPAERVGVQVGDRVVAIDGEDAREWPLEKVASTLKGESGSEVLVRFARHGVSEPIETAITRAVVRIPAVEYAVTLASDVAYVPLQQFNETAAEEVGEAIRSLVAEGASGMVLDLRGNGGGIVDEAVEIAGFFLPKGTPVARQWDRGGEEVRYVNPKDPIAPDLPLVVLVDGASASASEIVAGALQDHDRAVVLGTTSFGKGLVQTAYRLDGGYVLKMTTGKWFTPTGRSIHRERVLQNGRLVEVDDSTHFAAGRDERPAYHSSDGRVVYGGGGIMPDLEVPPDTLSTAEQELLAAIVPQSPGFSVTVWDYATELKAQVDPEFVVASEWRDELYHRLADRGVEIHRATWEAGSTYVDRLLMSRIGGLAFGDGYAKRRDLDADAPLVRAIELLHQGGPDQRALFGFVEHVKAGGTE